MVDIKEEEIKIWWNEVKDYECWSGAIRGMGWEDLLPPIKANLMNICDLVL